MISENVGEKFVPHARDGGWFRHRRGSRSAIAKCWLMKFDIELCEQNLRYRFRDRKLLERALTHASVAPTRLESNERLEFLGDAVLGLVVCESLFRRFDDQPEGELTRIKSSVVSGMTCARAADRIGLGDVLMMGKGLTSRREIPTSVTAAGLEAVIAAIYLDGGLAAAREFIVWAFEVELDEPGGSVHGRNYKSELQHFPQREFGETPGYQLLDEKGPDHLKCFLVSAVIASDSFPAAWGPSKKEAEQLAAKNALEQLQLDLAENGADLQHKNL